MYGTFIVKHGILHLGELSVVCAMHLGVCVLDVTLGGHLHQQVVKPENVGVRLECLPVVAAIRYESVSKCLV